MGRGEREEGRGDGSMILIGLVWWRRKGRGLKFEIHTGIILDGYTK